MDKIKRKRRNFRVVNGRITPKRITDYRLIFLLLLFIFGIVSGALSVKRGEAEFVERLSVLINSYRLARISQSFFANYCSSLLVNVLIQLCAVVSGFSSLGIPFIMMLPFVKGVALGAVSGHLYNTFALSGLGYCLVVLYPGNVISSMSLFIACNESCVLSQAIFNRIFSNSEKTVNLKFFALRQLFYLGVTAFSALLDTLLYSSFASFFTF